MIMLVIKWMHQNKGRLESDKGKAESIVDVKCELINSTVPQLLNLFGLKCVNRRTNSVLSPFSILFLVWPFFFIHTLLFFSSP